MKNIHVLQTDKPSNLCKNQHIYITNDEDIKKGDYVTDGWIVIKWKDDRGLLGKKKIILTTDQDLIKDGVQAIDDEFLEWFIKNPSFECIKTKKWLDDEGKVFYSRIIPKEKHKQETIEEAVKRLCVFNVSKSQDEIRSVYFRLGAEWQKNKLDKK